MKVETFRCDECQKSRDKDSNHWYMLYSDQSMSNKKFIEIRTFDPQSTSPWEHVCGQECLQKAINRMLVIL